MIHFGTGVQRAKKSNLHILVYVSVDVVGWVRATNPPTPLPTRSHSLTKQQRQQKKWCVTLAGVSKYGNASSPMYVRVGVGKKAKGALHHAGVLVMLRFRPHLMHAHTIYASKEKLLSATLRASELVTVRLKAPGVNQWLFFSTHDRCCIFYMTLNSKKNSTDR